MTTQRSTRRAFLNQGNSFANMHIPSQSQGSCYLRQLNVSTEVNVARSGVTLLAWVLPPRSVVTDADSTMRVNHSLSIGKRLLQVLLHPRDDRSCLRWLGTHFQSGLVESPTFPKHSLQIIHPIHHSKHLQQYDIHYHVLSFQNRFSRRHLFAETTEYGFLLCCETIVPCCV